MGALKLIACLNAADMHAKAHADVPIYACAFAQMYVQGSVGFGLGYGLGLVYRSMLIGVQALADK